MGPQAVAAPEGMERLETTTLVSHSINTAYFLQTEPRGAKGSTLILHRKEVAQLSSVHLLCTRHSKIAKRDPHAEERTRDLRAIASLPLLWSMPWLWKF